jgi:thiamine-phosphate pyrophosphorylase
MTHSIKKEAFIKPPFFISYLITDPIEFGNTPEKLKQSLSSTFKKYTVNIVCFRDKSSLNIEELAIACLEVCREFNIEKVLINSHIDLCKKLGFDGIHLNSQQFEEIKNLQNKNTFTIISCHNEDEIKLAKKYHSNAITYSPIFFKELKGKPKGLENLAKVISLYQEENFNIIALGGIIADDNVKDVIKTKAMGFASIRYFKV